MMCGRIQETEKLVVKNTFISVVSEDVSGSDGSNRPRSKTEPAEPFINLNALEAAELLDDLEERRERQLSFDVPQTPWTGEQGEVQSFGLPADESQLAHLTNQLQSLCQENRYLTEQLATMSSMGATLGSTQAQALPQLWVPVPLPMNMFSGPGLMQDCTEQHVAPRSMTNQSSEESTEPSDSEAMVSPAELPSPQTRSRRESAESTGEGTTVMLRNLPNNYTREMVLALLDDEGFSGKYDFFYLPIDFNSQASLGYAFVNLISHAAALDFRVAFEGFTNWVIPSKKKATVGWSGPYQGLKAHIQRYRSSPVMHASVPDECKPVVFQDGIRVPFPMGAKAPRKPRRARCVVPKAAGLLDGSRKLTVAKRS